MQWQKVGVMRLFMASRRWVVLRFFPLHHWCLWGRGLVTACGDDHVAQDWRKLGAASAVAEVTLYLPREQYNELAWQ